MLDESVKKRRHHFVWRHYIEAWTSDGRIFCCRDGQVFGANPKNVAVEGDFYRLQDLTDADVSAIRGIIALVQKDLRPLSEGWLAIFAAPFELRRKYRARGLKDQSVEQRLDVLFSNLEEEIHALLEEESVPLLASLRKGQAGAFETSDGFSRLMYFLSVQFMRTKRTKEAVRASLAGQMINVDNTWGVLRHMLATNMAAAFAARRDRYRLVFLRAPADCQLVTSDQPVINTLALDLPPGQAPESVEFYYPIAPRLALLVSQRDGPDRSAGPQMTGHQVATYNRMMADASHEQVFAADPALFENLGVSP
ncbi:MAG TPA: DUF4238 domain-containing protein [Vicinamibacterales bacterium]|nr:DUF4238 domain-containing protein [Vicinamibacterales bacterium]